MVSRHWNKISAQIIAPEGLDQLFRGQVHPIPIDEQKVVLIPKSNHKFVVWVFTYLSNVSAIKAQWVCRWFEREIALIHPEEINPSRCSKCKVVSCCPNYFRDVCIKDLHLLQLLERAWMCWKVTRVGSIHVSRLVFIDISAYLKDWDVSVSLATNQDVWLESERKWINTALGRYGS